MEGLQLRNLSQPNNYEVRSPFRLKEILLKTQNAKWESLINLLLLEIQEVKRYGGGGVVLVVGDFPSFKSDYNPDQKNTITWKPKICISKEYDYSP